MAEDDQNVTGFGQYNVVFVLIGTSAELLRGFEKVFGTRGSQRCHSSATYIQTGYGARKRLRNVTSSCYSTLAG